MSLMLAYLWMRARCRQVALDRILYRIPSTQVLRAIMSSRVTSRSSRNVSTVMALIFLDLMYKMRYLRLPHSNLLPKKKADGSI